MHKSFVVVGAWLTCPFLIGRLDKGEIAGGMKTKEQREAARCLRTDFMLFEVECSYKK